MMEQEALSVDTVVRTYIALRTEKDRINNEAKDSARLIDDQMKKLENWLQSKMNDDGVNSFATDAGTAYKSTVEQASVTDMDAFITYVRENDAFELLEKRVSKTAVRAMLDEGQPLPDGVNWYTSTAIHIRKPNER